MAMVKVTSKEEDVATKTDNQTTHEGSGAIMGGPLFFHILSISFIWVLEQKDQKNHSSAPSSGGFWTDNIHGQGLRTHLAISLGPGIQAEQSFRARMFWLIIKEENVYI